MDSADGDSLDEYGEQLPYGAEISANGMQMIDWWRCTREQKEALAPTHEGFVTWPQANQRGKSAHPDDFLTFFNLLDPFVWGYRRLR